MDESNGRGSPPELYKTSRASNNSIMKKHAMTGKLAISRRSILGNASKSLTIEATRQKDKRHEYRKSGVVLRLQCLRRLFYESVAR
jgi:hypothetical protein